MEHIIISVQSATTLSTTRGIDLFFNLHILPTVYQCLFMLIFVYAVPCEIIGYWLFLQGTSINIFNIHWLISVKLPITQQLKWKYFKRENTKQMTNTRLYRNMNHFRNKSRSKLNYGFHIHKHTIYKL